MILQFGFSWLGTLLCWCWICFPAHKGSNIAHGYSVNLDEFSNHAGALGPQTSNQFYSGASLNTDHDSISPRDENQAMRHQTFVSLQREPAHHEINEDVSSVTGFSEEMVQNKPEHEPDMFSVSPSSPSVQRYEHESSGYQHPFGLLVKGHMQGKHVDGISFPTIKDFQLFIETMKSSFLLPGSDLSRHFQTAREIVEKKVASSAQNAEGESDTGYTSNSAKKGSDHDASENEIWSEPMNAALGQSEQDTNYQMQSESLSVTDPVDFKASLISTSLYDNQDLGPGSALYPRPYLAATEYVSSHYGSSDSNPGISTSADVQNEETHSTSHKFPAAMPSDSFFGEDFSLSGHVTASPVNPPNSPSLYFSSTTSNITPLISEMNLQPPKYLPHSKDSSTGYKEASGGYELEDSQSEVLAGVKPDNVLSTPKSPSLNSYGKSLRVSAPRDQLYIIDYVPKHAERPAPSFQPFQPTIDNGSKDVNYTPTVNLPVSSDSVSSSFDYSSPQGSSDQVGVHTNPHNVQNQNFNKNTPSSLHGSSRHNGYLRDQSFSVTPPSVPIAQDKERSEPFGGLDSTQSRISSPVGVQYASFNSPANFAPTSSLETTLSRIFSNEVSSRNFGIKNLISDRFPTGDVPGKRKPLGSLFNPQRHSIVLNGGYVGATRAGLLQSFLHPTIVNDIHNKMAYRPLKPLSSSKVSGSSLNDDFGKSGNTKRLPPQAGLYMSTPSLNTYMVRSRNSYVRSKVSLSKTHYAPYQLEEGKIGDLQRKSKNAVSHNAKGFEEQ